MRFINVAFYVHLFQEVLKSKAERRTLIFLQVCFFWVFCSSFFFKYWI